jgi:aldose 1-epimerase
MGCTVGRYANRIAGGRIDLDGKEFALTANEGRNALHGGVHGFDRMLWAVMETQRGRTVSVTLRHVSADGDEGYPGKLTATAIYSLDDANRLGIEYRATSDSSTIVNITNHAYFNLCGEGSTHGAMGHLLTIPADEYTPVDNELIPTGEFRPVAGTPFDFRQPTRIGARIREAADPQMVVGRGYDHNWVISRRRAAAPRRMAVLEDPESGRKLELISDQPGLQFYSGNMLDGRLIGKAGRAYRQGDAVVLEPQLFPDTPNRPEFGSARLDPGDQYVNRMAYQIAVSG